MKVWPSIAENVGQGKKLHFTLIDPVDQSLKKTSQMARVACRAGTDAILVGGSTPIQKDFLDQSILQIREGKPPKVPIILFPSSSGFLSEKADAVFFMSLLNSKSPRYLVQEQVRGAPLIKRMGLETISMGYIIVEPGMAAGKVGKAKLVSRDDSDGAIRYGLTAQFFGMNLVYLEAGSGAPVSVPQKMVKAVRREIDIPLIVGGGITNSSLAQEKIDAGADIIVTGNIGERNSRDLSKIVSTIRKANKCSESKDNAQ